MVSKTTISAGPRLRTFHGWPVNSAFGRSRRSPQHKRPNQDRRTAWPKTHSGHLWNRINFNDNNTIDYFSLPRHSDLYNIHTNPITSVTLCLLPRHQPYIDRYDQPIQTLDGAASSCGYRPHYPFLDFYVHYTSRF